jgi:hypothetical protein
MSDADADVSRRDGGEEVASVLVVARDTAPMLKLVEEALDQIAASVALEIDAADDAHVALAWDVSNGTERGEQLDDAAGAVAAVGNRLARRAQTLDQSWQRGLVVGLAGCQQKAQRQPHSIDHGVNLGGQSSTRTVDGVMLAPLFPPAAC